jgi:hypothetical protein
MRLPWPGGRPAGHGLRTQAQVMNTAIATNWQVAAAHTKA